MKLRSRDLDKRVQLQRQAAGDDNDINSAGSRAWATFDTVWTKIEDVRPTRPMITDSQVAIAARRSDLFIRYRADIGPNIQILFGLRTLRIINGPAIVGSNEFLQLLVEDYSTAGEPA